MKTHNFLLLLLLLMYDDILMFFTLYDGNLMVLCVLVCFNDLLCVSVFSSGHGIMCGIHSSGEAAQSQGIHVAIGWTARV